MATNQKKAVVVVDFENNTINGFKQLEKGMDSAKKGTQSMTGSFFKAQLAVEAVKKGFQVFAGVARTVGNTLGELAERGGKVQDITVGFKRNFKDSEQALTDLRGAAKGTITDYDLMLSASKASMLGVTSNSKELAKLLEVARARGQAMGIDTTQAFEDIVTGIGRTSPMILDNLGITTNAYKEQLEAVEATGIEMTDAQKKQLLVATVLKDTTKAVDTNTTTWEQMKVQIQNTKDSVSESLAPAFAELASSIFPSVKDGLSGLSDWFVDNKDAIAEGAKAIGESIRAGLDKVSVWWQEEGKPFVEGFIKGWKETGDAEAYFDILDGRMEQLTGKSKEDATLTGEWWGQTFKELIVGWQTIFKTVRVGWLELQTIEDRLKERIIKNGEFIKKKITGVIDSLIIKWREFVNSLSLDNISTTIANAGKSLLGLDSRAVGGMTQGGMTQFHKDEVAIAPRGTKVIPKDRVSKELGGQPMVVNINVNGGISDERMVNMLAQKIQDITARQNKLSNYNVI